MPSISAQVQAAIAASVGVNQPKVMPPTMMIGVISAGSAAMKVLQQRRSSETPGRGPCRRAARNR